MSRAFVKRAFTAIVRLEFANAVSSEPLLLSRTTHTPTRSQCRADSVPRQQFAVGEHGTARLLDPAAPVPKLML